MRADTIKKLFTVREYHRMGEAGIFGPEERTELIEGEILQMSPIGHRHSTRVLRAITIMTSALNGKALVNAQNPIELNDYSEPQPDLVVLKYRADFYQSEERISPKDTLLVLEISDTTLRYDRKIKLPLYAAAGVPEVWIEDLNAGELLVYRDLVGDSYQTTLTLHHGDSVSITAFPEIEFKVSDLLG